MPFDHIDHANTPDQAPDPIAAEVGAAAETQQATAALSVQIANILENQNPAQTPLLIPAETPLLIKVTNLKPAAENRESAPKLTSVAKVFKQVPVQAILKPETLQAILAQRDAEEATQEANLRQNPNYRAWEAKVKTAGFNIDTDLRGERLTENTSFAKIAEFFGATQVDKAENLYTADGVPLAFSTAELVELYLYHAVNNLGSPNYDQLPRIIAEQEQRDDLPETEKILLPQNLKIQMAELVIAFAELRANGLDEVKAKSDFANFMDELSWKLVRFNTDDEILPNPLMDPNNAPTIAQIMAGDTNGLNETAQSLVAWWQRLGLNPDTGETKVFPQGETPRGDYQSLLDLAKAQFPNDPTKAYHTAVNQDLHNLKNLAVKYAKDIAHTNAMSKLTRWQNALK